MTPEQMSTLVDNYGDACFDCGEWQLDQQATVAYGVLCAKQQETRTALLDAIAAVLAAGGEHETRKATCE
mgnify:CR=1 FL=1